MNGQGVLITGRAGQGKSTLAIALIGQGARLVADDQVYLHSAPQDILLATRPATLPGWIEARGIGLLQAPLARSASISWVIDMDTDETERMPPQREITILGHVRPLLYRGEPLHFASAVAHLLRHGRSQI